MNLPCSQLPNDACEPCCCPESVSIDMEFDLEYCCDEIKGTDKFIANAFVLNDRCDINKTVTYTDEGNWGNHEDCKPDGNPLWNGTLLCDPAAPGRSKIKWSGEVESCGGLVLELDSSESSCEKHPNLVQKKKIHPLTASRL